MTVSARGPGADHGVQFRTVGRRLVADTHLPGWLRPLVSRIDGATTDDVLPFRMRFGPVRRRSAVLILLAEGPEGPDLLLTARAATLRSHAGQPAFPGGASDPGEDPIATALRESWEETGVDPASVRPAALLPDLYLMPSEYLVSPVLAYWPDPGPVAPVDPAETAAVARVPISALADPGHRGRVRHPSGYTGPAFEVADMLVWGFTAGVIDGLLDLAGWSRPWDPDRLLELPVR